MHLCLIYDFSIFVCERGLAIKKEYVLPNTPQRNLRYCLKWTNAYIILYQRHFVAINRILKFSYILLDINSTKKLYRNKIILSRVITNMYDRVMSFNYANKKTRSEIISQYNISPVTLKSLTHSFLPTSKM